MSVATLHSTTGIWNEKYYSLQEFQLKNNIRIIMIYFMTKIDRLTSRCRNHCKIFKVNETNLCQKAEIHNVEGEKISNGQRVD